MLYYNRRALYNLLQVEFTVDTINDTLSDIKPVLRIFLNFLFNSNDNFLFFPTFYTVVIVGLTQL